MTPRMCESNETNLMDIELSLLDQTLEKNKNDVKVGLVDGVWPVLGRNKPSSQ